MKKLYRNGLAVLLSLSVVAMVGCGDSPSVQQRSVSATPTKATPKITVTTEDRSSERAYPSEATLGSAERAPSADSCQSDAECITVPEPRENCIPCMGQGGQRAVSKAGAKQIMSGLKEVCMPKIQELQSKGQGNHPAKSQDASCQFNGARCVQGQCQLANVQQAQQGTQGAPQGAGIAPGSSIPVGEWNSPNNNYPGNHLREPSTNGFGNAQAPWAGRGFPGSTGDSSSSFPGYRNGQSPWANPSLSNGQSPWGNYPGTTDGQAPWANPSSSLGGRTPWATGSNGNSAQWSPPSGYGQNNSYPGNFNSPLTGSFPGAANRSNSFGPSFGR